jgi:hypothetical protein
MLTTAWDSLSQEVVSLFAPLTSGEDRSHEHSTDS